VSSHHPFLPSFPTRRSSDLVFHLPGLASRRTEVEQAVETQLADRFKMDWKLAEASRPQRVAIFASKTDHCLLDLLWRHRRGNLRSEEHTSELQSRFAIVCRL